MSDDQIQPDGVPEQPVESQDQGTGPSADENPLAEDIGTHALGEAVRVAFVVMLLMLVALLTVYAYKCVFTVQQHEVKVKLRFGKPLAVKMKGTDKKSCVMAPGSGYHFRWPFEEVVSIATTEQSLDLDKVFMAYRRKLTAIEEQQIRESGRKLHEMAQELSVKTDGFLITGDVNIVHLQLKVRYRVSSGDSAGVRDYAFRFRSPETLLERFAMASAIETVGSWNVMDILRKHRRTEGGRQIRLQDEIKSCIVRKSRAFREANSISVGIDVMDVELTDPKVPASVGGAFKKAQLANDQKGRLETEAHKFARAIKESAVAEADRVVKDARSYATRLLEAAKADKEMLKRLREAYDESPQVAAMLRDRHYHRMVTAIFAPSEDSFVLHREAPGSAQELRLRLSPVSKRVKNKVEELRRSKEAEQAELVKDRARVAGRPVD